MLYYLKEFEFLNNSKNNQIHIIKVNIQYNQ